MKRIVIPLMIVAALGLAVVGVGAGFAQEEGSGAVDGFLAKVAAKLGVGEDELKTAVDEAYDETIDEKVASGDLTQDQADRLKEHGFKLAPMFGPRFGVRAFVGGVELFQKAADVLGLTHEELMTELRDGKSLAEVAEAQGISVETLKSDLLSAVKLELDGLVADGKLTQTQADKIYSETESHIDNIVNADAPGFFRKGCPPGPFGGPLGEEAPDEGDSAAPGSAVQPETGL